MSARMVIRDVARVLDIPYADADKLAKMVPMELHITIKKALDNLAYEGFITSALCSVETGGETNKMGDKLAVEIEQEGAVLAKNDNNILPLSKDNKVVNVFGHSVVDWLISNSGSGSAGPGSEQKAVGLAVFFAEIQNKNYPIILDDPTTSLDHRIAAKLANRLLSFNNQTIVFTHYQLFINSLKSTSKGHFCNKYGESTCGKNNKHIFAYEIDENLSKKGIVNRYSQRDSKTIIAQIENEISTINTSDLKDVPKNIRKCVEYLIDDSMKYLDYNPFYLALASVCIIRENLGINKWNKAFNKYYKINLDDIEDEYNYSKM